VRRALLLAAVVTVAGCGGSGSGAGHLKAAALAGPVGSGANEAWFLAAKGKPRSLVIYLHGYGGPTEETPANHVPWLKHLAAEGSDVIYPRYEVGGSPDPYPNIDAAVSEAKRRLGEPHVPAVVIGYSRGGRVAVDYAATRAARGAEPAAVLSIFPGLNSPYEKLGPLAELDSKLKLVIMVGDKDTSVGGVGARAVLARLQAAAFPASRIQLIIVRSKGRFVANHLSVMQTSPGAQDAFWKPADQLIDSVR
jgi:pimeloyl-ACP methyl ester carboxylesterase